MSDGTRIDIAVRENGADTVLRGAEQVAAAAQKLSPALAASLRGEALRLGVHLQGVVKNAAKAILETVVYATPHDTGKARANWNVAINQSRPSTQTTEETDYEGQATVAKGQAKIDSAKLNPGQVVFISNALPYIQRLNEGWSQQAPAGFVERAVQAGSASVKRGT